MLNLFLDSGAWSHFTGRANINLDMYSKFLTRYKNEVKIFANLDVVHNGEASYQNWLELKKQGHNTMPVFHADIDLKYLKRYLENSNTIALGALVGVNKIQRLSNLDYLWKHFLTNSQGYPTHKVHGFALTDIDIMVRYPWYSVDSSTWIKHAAYGMILVPKKGLETKPNFLGPAMAVSLSDVSGRMYGEEGSNSFSNFSKHEQKLIRNYVKNTLHLEWGRSEFLEVENDYKLLKNERFITDKELKGASNVNMQTLFPVHFSPQHNKKMIERIIEPGVSNYVNLRIRANIRYYKLVMQAMPYPKKFEV